MWALRAPRYTPANVRRSPAHHVRLDGAAIELPVLSGATHRPPPVIACITACNEEHEELEVNFGWGTFCGEQYTEFHGVPSSSTWNNACNPTEFRGAPHTTSDFHGTSWSSVECPTEIHGFPRNSMEPHIIYRVQFSMRCSAAKSVEKECLSMVDCLLLLL